MQGDQYPDNWDEIRREVYSQDDYECQTCGAQGGKAGNTELHAHHKKPISEGGSNEMSNLITLCKDCHNRQHDHDISDDGRARTDDGPMMVTITDALKIAEALSYNPQETRSSGTATDWIVLPLLLPILYLSVTVLISGLAGLLARFIFALVPIQIASATIPLLVMVVMMIFTSIVLGGAIGFGFRKEIFIGYIYFSIMGIFAVLINGTNALTVYVRGNPSMGAVLGNIIGFMIFVLPLVVAIIDYLYEDDFKKSYFDYIPFGNYFVE